jgi:hypothetical protein
MLTKETTLDKIEVLEDGQIQVRMALYVLEDGVRLTEPQYRRTVVVPGDVTTHLPARVQAVAQTVWTPAVLAAWRQKHPLEENA